MKKKIHKEENRAFSKTKFRELWEKSSNENDAN